MDDGPVAGTSYYWESNENEALGNGGWCATAATDEDLTASADHRHHSRGRHWANGVLCGIPYTLDTLDGERPVYAPSGSGTPLKIEWLCPHVRPFIPLQLFAHNSMRSSEGLPSGNLSPRPSPAGTADLAQASPIIEETRNSRARADRGDTRDRAGR